MQMVRNILIAGIVFLGALGGFGPGRTAEVSSATDGQSEPLPVQWKHLAYRGSHFLGEATTEVSLAEVPAAEVQKQLISVPKGSPLEASTCAVMVIDVQSRVDPLFGADDRTGSRAWFSSDNAAALQRIRSRHGNDIWQNTYRFARSGVYRIRKKPARAAEKQLAPAHWTKIKESFFAFPAVGPESKIVLEPTGLLYLAANLAARSPTAPRRLYVFDRKQLHEVTVQVDGRQRLKVNYVERGPREEVKRSGKTDAVRISFKPRALAQPGEPAEEFSFMGLKGDFEIYIDPASRLPLEVSGQIARIGKIHVRLQTVEF